MKRHVSGQAARACSSCSADGQRGDASAVLSGPALTASDRNSSCSAVAASPFFYKCTRASPNQRTYIFRCLFLFFQEQNIAQNSSRSAPAVSPFRCR